MKFLLLTSVGGALPVALLRASRHWPPFRRSRIDAAFTGALPPRLAADGGSHAAAHDAPGGIALGEASARAHSARTGGEKRELHRSGGRAAVVLALAAPSRPQARYLTTIASGFGVALERDRIDRACQVRGLFRARALAPPARRFEIGTRRMSPPERRFEWRRQGRGGVGFEAAGDDLRQGDLDLDLDRGFRPRLDDHRVATGQATGEQPSAAGQQRSVQQHRARKSDARAAERQDATQA